MDRRTFLRMAMGIGSAGLAAPLMKPFPLLARFQETQAAVPVALVKTTDRVEGTKRALDLLGIRGYDGEHVFVKPNFNSADPTPGSTHNDVLATLVEQLQAAGAERITVGDRSGMGDTRQVMEQKGIFDLAARLKFDTLVFDELGASEWELFQPQGSHWGQGFALPKPVLAADAVVQTCCLKTHRYGGHFTLSLKNSVGLAAKTIPGEGYNYMRELHSSPDQRRMIAEINAAYTPDFVLMDGVEAFVNGGPAAGDLVQAGVMLASADRVAIDAVGVAILRYFGTMPAVSEGRIFEQEQIARAVELGLGVSDPAQIGLVTDDAASAEFAESIQTLLKAG